MLLVSWRAPGRAKKSQHTENRHRGGKWHTPAQARGLSHGRRCTAASIGAVVLRAPGVSVKKTCRTSTTYGKKLEEVSPKTPRSKGENHPQKNAPSKRRERSIPGKVNSRDLAPSPRLGRLWVLSSSLSIINHLFGAVLHGGLSDFRVLPGPLDGLRIVHVLRQVALLPLPVLARVKLAKLFIPVDRHLLQWGNVACCKR